MSDRLATSTLVKPAWASATLIAAAYTTRGAILSFLYIVLPVIMRSEGIALPMIGLAMLVFLPVGLTFLWAPLIDRFYIGWLGRRRTWLLLAAVVAAFAFSMLAGFDPRTDIVTILALSLIVAAAGGTMGTACDAYIIDAVDPSWRGWANALQAAGAALGGLIIAAIGTLYGGHGWAGAAWAMAAIAATVALILLIYPLPREHGGQTAITFLRGWRKLIEPPVPRILVVIVISRAGIHLPMGVLGALQVDSGLSVAQASFLSGAGGSIVGLIGAGLGGFLATRLAPVPAVVVTMGLLGASALAIGLALLGTGPTAPIAVAMSAHVFLLTSPVFVAMHRQFMQAVDPAYAASQMSALTGAEFTLGMLVAATSGFIALQYGYAAVLLVAAASALVSVFCALRWL